MTKKHFIRIAEMLKNQKIAIQGLNDKDFKILISNIENELSDLIQEGKVFVSIIPDIESVNYGRNVGYEIIEHKPPTKIKKVSATKIRQKLRKSGKL